MILLLIIIAVAFLLHYGYKLAFYYEDPQASPYDYGNSDQMKACKKVIDAAIAEFEAEKAKARSKSSTRSWMILSANRS